MPICPGKKCEFTCFLTKDAELTCDGSVLQQPPLFQRYLAREKENREVKKKKNSMDDYLDSTFLADLYDKPISVSLYEVVKIEEPVAPSRTSVLRRGGKKAAGSRVRLSAALDADARKSSMEALAKRQLILANAELPIKERYSLIRRASLLGFGAKADMAVEEGDEEDAAQQEEESKKKKSKPEKQKPAREAPKSKPKVGSHEDGFELKTLPADTSLRYALPVRPRTSSPRRRPTNLAELDDNFDLREPAQPHHYDKPERHLSARSRSARTRRSPESSEHQPLNAMEEEPERAPRRMPSLERQARPPPKPTKPSQKSASDISPAKETEVNKEALIAPQEPSRKKPTATEPKPHPRVVSEPPVEKPARHKAPAPRASSAHARPPVASKDAPKETKKKNEIRHELRARLELDPTDLFWGDLTVATEVEDKVEGLEFCRIALALSAPLLSKEQEEGLNPVSITLLEADGMPDKPVSFEELDRTCLPVFTRFKFFSDAHTHQASTTQPHGRRITFNTRHLILAGLLDEDKLRDDLLNKRFVVEIHDRDIRPPGDVMSIAQDVGASNTAQMNLNGKHSYGYASFSLADLAMGMKHVELITPILPGRHRPASSTSSIPAGLWLESAATLSIRVELKYPILANTASTGGALSEGLFGRVVIVTSAQDESIAELVHETIVAQNLKALNIQAESEKERRMMLDAYTLSDEDKRNVELDILTGYHIFDSQMRILLVEGLLDGGTAHLFEILPKSDAYHLWYNPSITFTSRIWLATPGLLYVKLDPSLSEIMRQTSTYLRKRTSSESFECLEILNQILHLDSSSTPTPIGHYPSTDLINAVAENFGQVVPFEVAAPKAGRKIRRMMERNGSGGLSLSDVDEHDQASRTSLATFGSGSSVRGMAERGEKRVAATNEDFEQWLAFRSLRQPNFLAINVRQFKGVRRPPRERDYQENPVHNYSMQTFSTTAAQLKSLRARMEEDGQTVFSYGGKFLSQLISQVDYDQEIRKEMVESRRKWITKDGFRPAPYGRCTFTT
ncbi:uncharacterized protein SPPG_09092 [Spizellomyces punctatus DAOM BR117]|uniref:Uncharacterized protein n=1 Tax=Spizellomyces punctatus (strain DAOM BR117) TaxID=645134 RepID=A0A0L0HJS2_SPIPD|nr:uncharacterized protein SPPG_09092 [Spizellomyces punctatus DAOM BR117]KND01372.1 hypothetical protein SPPG_09092 [Spizellomyces punctatus DAOM BR117]|eukprot:XP_016609411.1 hypothetical protein SPPG_09092 [Spizellomyces punctatus DAOM BR117]